MGQSGSDFDGQVVARPDRHLRQDGTATSTADTMQMI